MDLGWDTKVMQLFKAHAWGHARLHQHALDPVKGVLHG